LVEEHVYLERGFATKTPGGQWSPIGELATSASA